MEGKVLLYDSNDVKIGETFKRRAKQLVKQQRATWIDDKQEAIRFAPGAEKIESTATNEDGNNTIATVSDSIFQDDVLIALAERRIKERNRIIIHTIAFIPCWFLLLWFASTIWDTWHGRGNASFMLFATGSWITAYIIHVCQFAIPRLKGYFKHGSQIAMQLAKQRGTSWVERKEERRIMKLAAEVAKLKSELQRQ